jgi:hypothetical protein
MDATDVKFASTVEEPAVALSMWAIYESPKDFPGLWVARRHEVAGAKTYATTDYFVGESKGEVLKKIPPGLHRLERMPDDEPQIVEVWL